MSNLQYTYILHYLSQSVPLYGICLACIITNSSSSIIIVFALYNIGYTYHTYIQVLHYKVAGMPPKGLCEKPLAGRPPVPTPQRLIILNLVHLGI